MKSLHCLVPKLRKSAAARKCKTERRRIFLPMKLKALLSAVVLAASGVAALSTSAASAQVYGVNVQSYSAGADLDVYLQSYSAGADKDVYVAGRCRGTGSTDVYIQSYSAGADESWYVQSYSAGADMEICLSGDIEHWFENVD